MSKAGVPVISRDGKITGVTTGDERPCTLEGCGGRRIGVSWPPSAGIPQVTYPCTKGMAYRNGVWKIGKFQTPELIIGETHDIV